MNPLSIPLSRHHNSQTDNMKTADQNDNNFDQNSAKWFWRYREITGMDENGNYTYGPWTKYRRTIANSYTEKKLNANETDSLIPDKRYEIEMALMVIDQSKKMVYWPYDNSVMGTGTGFEGYKAGWSDGKTTAKKDYSSSYTVGRSMIKFESDQRCIGSFENPVKAGANESVSDKYKYTIKQEGTNIMYGHYQGHCVARVQKFDGSTWIEDDISKWTIQEKSSILNIAKTTSVPGLYRISMMITNGGGRITQWNGDVWSPQYTVTNTGSYLLCGSNGKDGYVYMQVE